MEVWCGMIMGFDNDDEGIFERQVRFVQEARIAFSMSGMLAAIPKTPLHDRLAAEGRLDTADVCEYGTNVIPLRMTRGELRDGYIRVLNAIYEPSAYLDRTDSLFLQPSFEYGIKKFRNWLTWPGQYLVEVTFLFQAIGLFIRLMTLVPEASLAASTGDGSGDCSGSIDAPGTCWATCSTWRCIIMPTAWPVGWPIPRCS